MVAQSRKTLATFEIIEPVSTQSMKAITKYRYGGPEVLQLKDIEKPELKEGDLLIRVMANSANPADWHIMRGEPVLARFAFGLLKPKVEVLGCDFAGVVDAVGDGVTGFRAGDRVFGETLRTGAFAEFTAVPAKACAKMPDELEFIQMACIPIAGVTALQALITHGKLEKGQSVLINGSSGGVGHFAVQIAKAYGAKVTGVCSSRNRDFVQSLGADEVIAYDEQNIHQYSGKHDLVLDTHGNLTFQDYLRMGRQGVSIGFTSMGHMLRTQLRAGFSKYSLTQFTAEANTRDLETLAALVLEGKVIPHIEKTYTASEIPQAIAYIEAMRTRGKVAMLWEEEVEK